MSFDSLPPELLAEIFGQAAEDHLLAPVTLSHVCNGWRKAAISEPSLWTTVSIQTDQENKNPHYSYIKTFLDRSKSLPLTITLENYYGGVTMTDVIEMLAQHSFRWRSFELVHSGLICLKPLLQPAPLLRKLSITTFSLNDAGFSAISRFLQVLPSMTSLSLHLEMQPAKRLSSIAPSIAYGSLTDLTLYEWCATPLLVVLGQCVRLQHFIINGLTFHEQPSVHAGQNLQPVNLPDLCTISIYQETLDGSIRLLFDNLTCPNLQHLDISSGFVDNFQWPNKSVASFLRRSACPLQSLLFEMVQITEDQLIECLEACSSTLEYLDVVEQRDVFCVRDKLLNKLTVRAEHHDASYKTCTVLCPKLRAFQVSGAVDCQDGALATFLRSKQPSNICELACDRCVSLRTTCIQIRKKFWKRLRSDIGYLKENGHWVT